MSIRVLQAGIVVILGSFTLLVVGDQRFSNAVAAPSTDLVLHTTAALVALAVAMLGWVRAREADDGAALLDGAAFLILGLANAIHVVLITTETSGLAGLAPTDPRAAPVAAWSVVRFVAIALILVAAVPRAREARRSTARAAAMFLAPAILALGLGLGILVEMRGLDGMVGPAVLDQLATARRPPLLATPVVDLLNLTGAVLLGLAAWVRPARQGGALPRAWLAAALTVGAFSQLHAVLNPSVFPGVVTSAAVLQLAFYLTLFVALLATRADDLREARLVHERRRRFHHADVGEAVATERVRLARELHDGLVQGLLAVKREHATLVGQLAAGDPGASATADRIGDDLAETLAEARRSLDQLRDGVVGTQQLGDGLSQRLRAFSQRYGHTHELRADPSVTAVVGRRAAEVLRVVDEALANIRRHADATNVRVIAAIVGDQLILTIADNGRGFVPERTAPGHGITGMRERAGLLGGRLTIHSAAGEGTQLRLFAPLRADDDG